jgi:hypothetical protein
MRDIRIAKFSRCVRSVGENKAPETWPFSMEFVPKEEPEGCEWRGREREEVCTLYRWRGTQLVPERHIVCVFYIVTCPGAVWPVIELSRPLLHIPEIKDSCEHKGVVQSACDTDRVQNFPLQLQENCCEWLYQALPTVPWLCIQI